MSFEKEEEIIGLLKNLIPQYRLCGECGAFDPCSEDRNKGICCRHPSDKFPCQNQMVNRFKDGCFDSVPSHWRSKSG